MKAHHQNKIRINVKVQIIGYDFKQITNSRSALITDSRYLF